MKKINILIIEDDPAIIQVARETLEKDGYAVDCAGSAQAGFQRITRQPPDLLVLDLNLPDGDGLDLCRKLASSPSTRGIPVFMVTARAGTEAVVEGLEAGAQDYMVKPFNMREFLARVRAIVRHSPPQGPKESDLESGKLKLSPRSHEVWQEGKPVSLTLREFDVLRVLMASEGKALKREEIIAYAWGPSTSIVERVIDVHVSHMRAKLGKEGKRIETVPQVGFKLAAAKR